VHLVNEELSFRRQALKIFSLPAKTACEGTLYIYACNHPGCKIPLQVKLNNHLYKIKPDRVKFLHWFSLPVNSVHLKSGENSVEIWSENTAWDGWTLGIDGTVENRSSRLSFDGGKTWTDKHMSVYHCLSGEYIVRLRLDDPGYADPGMPRFVGEQPTCPLFEELHRIIPSRIKKITDPWEKALELSSWVSEQWDYVNNFNGIEYAPWDPLTILSWGKNKYGHSRENPIVMCVHYAIVYCSAAMALGIPARNLCVTDELDDGAGHFTCEVWIDKWQKWCQVDANCDLAYLEKEIPLSVAEIWPKRDKLASLARKGSGFIKQSVGVRDYALKHFITGTSFKYWAVWPRNDYYAHPECSPPAHGVADYAETDWLWAKPGKETDLGMFPYRIEADLLKAAPVI